MRDQVEYLTRALFARLCQRAAESSRGRVNFNFHEFSDHYQRMLNVVQPGSYIRPHCHTAPAKSESFIVLTGEIGFFRFGEDGKLADAQRLGPGRAAVGVDLLPGVWHSFLALENDTVVFEGKTGPYNPEDDKRFASWAPAEGSPAADAYVEKLLSDLPAR